MDDEQPGEDVGTGELTAEQQRRDPRSDDRDRQRDGIGDAQPGARQLIVEQRVAGEPVEDGKDEQRHADHPVDLARSAECAGEEHAPEMDDNCREKQERRPMVDLTHEQPGAHVEAQVDGRAVRLGHVHALQRSVAAVVNDLGRAGMEEERQVHARGDEYDERIQGQLTEHERPVVGKHLVQCGAHEVGGTEATIEPASDALRGRRRRSEVGRHLSRSQKPGPTGSEKSPRAIT